MALLAAAINCPAQAKDTSFAPAPTVILAFGDSLTAGYGVTESQSLPAQIEARLKQDGYDVRVVNAGVNGDTTGGGLLRLEWVLQQTTPDVAILELGANDMLRGFEPSLTEENLQKMIDIFSQHNIPVLLVGMKAFRNLGLEHAKAYDDVFPRLAEKNDLLFYPFLLEGVALQPALNQGDGVHPNAQGVEKVADSLLPAVKKLIALDKKQK